MHDKIRLRLIEDVTLVKRDGSEKKIKAKMDTGASLSSIDKKLASELKISHVLRSKLVKSANGKQIRPVVRVPLTIAGRTFEEEFTITDRSHLKFMMLIGINILKQGFLVDPGKK